MKKMIFIALILTVCGASLGLFYDKLEQQMMPKSSDMLVLGLPQDYRPKSIKESYQGPHPAAITRPEDTFYFPIKPGQVGPIKPLFSGENDYPFLCGTYSSGLGQPLVDNQNKVGIAVYQEDEHQRKTKKIMGYSKDCSLPTRIEYFVKDEALMGYRKINDNERNDHNVNELIRVETGTINRFIYVMALPVSKQDTIEKFDGSKWNHRLVYRFKGGVGVGRKQGHIRIEKLLYEHEEQLTQGYALAFSTGTQTSNHYDIWLSEDTALRVKKQFSASYGQPIYTVGIGGSGGAIQQYLLAQNSPGIIDAAIPLYSYPDMASQVSYALDCELMEYYFDVTSDNEKWAQWDNRRLIEGSNTLHDVKNKYGKLQGIAGVMNGDFSLIPQGASECTNGWRGPSHLINNPQFFAKYHEVSRETFLQIDWSHWGNLRHVYGTGKDGFAKRFWDNQGVQYGLASLKSGDITVAEFLDINTYIGGWKAPKHMENERFWHVSGDSSLSRISLWGQHNMTHEGKRSKAPRTQGDQSAVEAAYASGLVFLGQADLPIIDLRHYLDHKLDMHHSVASFTARKRIEHAMGSSDHQLIWMMEKDPNLSRRDLVRSLPVNDALRVLDKWLINMKGAPEKSVAENRPDVANDRCYDHYQNVLASGDTAWDGQWNDKSTGQCQSRFPHFQHSRLMAGDNIYGDTLICDRISVDQAINSDLYGKVDMRNYKGELQQIFPDGVCNYSKQPHASVQGIVQKLKKSGLQAKGGRSRINKG